MKSRWRRRGISALIAFLLCTACFLPLRVLAVQQPAPREVIRVGFPSNPGLSQVDEHGNYSGYTYDYLQEIAQYTGWEYEFVRLPGTQNEVLSKMYAMLEAGELDLMGATNYSEALDKRYDYAANSYGSVYSTLEVLEENTSVSDTGYHALQHIHVAVLAHAKKGIAALEKFCSDNHITIELVPCEDVDAQLAALRENRASALLSNDAADLSGTRIIARFNPQPFYFATTNGNDEVINQLDRAMLMLHDSDPYFSATLYQKYFSAKVNLLHFSSEELHYLDTAPTLRVGVVRGRLPLEDIDANGAFHGISVDVLDMIAAATGLEFELVSLPSMQALLERLQTKEIDLALGITYDYNHSQRYNFSLSKPYLSAQVIMATKSGVNPYELSGKRLAAPRGASLGAATPHEVVWCDSVLDCLKAVDSGAADYCYGNGYSIEYYCNLYRYRHLILVPQSSSFNQYCIGVARPAEPLLLTVLNKTIRNFSQSELQATIYQNSTPSAQGVTLRDVIEANPSQTFSVLALFALLVCALLFYFAWFQRRARQRVQIENERYRLLSELSGEFLFEYSFASDRLVLTEKTVQTFGGTLVQEHYRRDLLRATDEISRWLSSIYERAGREKSLVLEHQVTLAENRTVWLRITIATITDANGHATYFIGKIADIQAEKQALDALSIQAKTDGLTGLYHITEARTLIEHLMDSQPDAAAGTLLIMDIDHFKAINDRFGHYTGDTVLQNVSTVLQQVFRTEDVLGRLGGDEFLVFLKGVTSEAIIAKKCVALQTEMMAHSTCCPVPVTLSIGAAIASPTTGYPALYRCADNALYAVKAAGRNSFRIVTAEDSPQD